MKIDAVLFDLDNTLLTNSMTTFVPKYFALLSDYALPRFADKQAFLQELLAGTQAMMTRGAGRLTNRELFWEIFETRTGESAAELEPFFDTFYETTFRELREACGQRPVAVDFVRDCFARGLKVVIATNPLFPRRAVEHRLAWAGLPVEKYDFALVTTYDNMHASKPNIEYYREILECIDVAAGRALMIGDDWEGDIAPASSLGIATFWICDEGQSAPEPELIAGSGSLEDAFHWFRALMQVGR